VDHVAAVSRAVDGNFEEDRRAPGDRSFVALFDYQHRACARNQPGKLRREARSSRRHCTESAYTVTECCEHEAGTGTGTGA
jgi:hypothetical protein